MAATPNSQRAVNADTITLAGTAATRDQNAVDTDAKHTWANLNVVDSLAVNGSVPPPSAAPAGSCTGL
ncbi:MAG: hypothetical protein WAO15_10385 [Mycobacterium sp.]